MVTYRSLSSLRLGFAIFVIFTFILKVDGQCTSTKYQCDNEKCIPQIWVCDSEDDCGDASDERNCVSRTCSASEFECTETEECIPARWQCDGDADCADHSDELESMCDQKTCASDFLSCGSQCIPMSWLCDGEPDCDDSTDETGCNSFTCSADEYPCGDRSRCITPRWVCDRESDCDDGSDEVGCPEPSCAPDEFKCNATALCIHSDWRCDGENDCSDGSDELGCEVSDVVGCEGGLFHCGNGDCIHMPWRCDGEPDCLRGTDEENCAVMTCSAYQLTCTDGTCAYGDYCDNVVDCADGSDETSCNVTEPCLQDQFKCNDGACIAMDRFCDDFADCPEGEDEPDDGTCSNTTVNECESSPCDHRCTDKTIGFTCSCDEGYKTGETKTSCVDIDECLEVPGACSQSCFNHVGGFKCSCQDGFYLHANVSCKAVGPPSAVIYVYHHGIRIYNQSIVDGRELYRDLRHPLALDIGVRNKMLFWSDTHERRILMGKSNPGENDVPTVLLENTTTVDGIAYDWVHNNIYWTDTDTDIISVASVATGHRRVLVSEGLDEPRDIAVHPSSGYMFWTDWGAVAKIEKALMNGNGAVSVVVDASKADILWPNGLTIDYQSRLLFWVDGKLNSLASCDFDGARLTVVLRDPRILVHPFSLSIFEDYAYWTDWEAHAIRKVNKFTGQGMVEVLSDLSNESPNGMHIWHDVNQPQSTNKCGANNGGCSGICVPAPSDGTHAGAYTCLCPNDVMMSEDGRTCVGDALVSVGNGVTPESNDIPAEEGGTGVTKGYNVIDHNDSVEPMKQTTTSAHIPLLLLLLVVACIIVCILVLPLVIFIWRRNAAGGKRSMNFDNPVYRKTTEDEVFLNTTLTYEHNPGKGSKQPMIPTDENNL